MTFEQMKQIKAIYEISKDGTMLNKKSKYRSIGTFREIDGRYYFSFGNICSKLSRARAIKLFHDWRDDNEYLDVHHMNGNKTDDRLDNLQWLTKEEHLKIHNDIKKEIRDSMEYEIIQDLKNGLLKKDIMEKYNVGYKNIYIAIKNYNLPIYIDREILKDKAINLYKEGLKTSEITSVLDISSSTVSRYLKDYKKSLKSIIPMEYNKGGISQREIAKKYNISHPTVVKYIKEYNIENHNI